MKKLKLTESQKKDLLQAVRHTIEQKLFPAPKVSMPSLSDPVFSEHFGLFVTLTTMGNLRGCIGYVEGIKPIKDAVMDMAIQAAFHDPRFHPLKENEYQFIDIEISILYPVERVTDLKDIQVGRDGLIMERGYSRGLLLPQVATDYGWDREEFMNHTCQKAGMESRCWEKGATVYKFEAEVFNEKDFHDK